MKSVHWSLCFLLLLIVLALPTLFPVRGQGRRQKQFQFQAFDCSGLQRNCIAQLNALGQDGWELKTMSYGGLRWYFVMQRED